MAVVRRLVKMNVCVIVLFSLLEVITATQWPIQYKRVDQRPTANPYCQAGVLPFCPTGRTANSMPRFQDTDKVELYALKKPVWQFKFGNLLGKLHIMHDALGIKNLNTGLNYTMEWYELFQLFNCTFPHVLKNESVTWCNQGATCIYDGIEDHIWKQNGTLQKISELSGKQYNQFAEWVLWDNTTGIYYETWTVAQKPGGQKWFMPFDCASWVLRAIEQLASYGVTFDTSVKLNYTRINLYSEEPVYLGNASVVFADVKLSKEVRSFYKKFQSHLPKPATALNVLSAVLEVIIEDKFYLFYNEEYWFLKMKYPYVKLTYDVVPLPDTKLKYLPHRFP